MNPLLQILVVVLHDSSWAAIGVLVAIGLFLFEQMRLTRKVLAYKVIDDSLLSHPLHNTARCITWKLWNCGSDHILPIDYDNNIPIEFMFGQNAQVLDASVLKTVPRGINLTLTRQINKVALEPFLLNSREVIILKFWVARVDRVYVYLHIAGGRIIDVDDYCQKSVNLARTLRNIAVGLFLLWIISVFIRIRYPVAEVWYVVSLLLAISISSLATLGIFIYLMAKLRYK